MLPRFTICQTWATGNTAVHDTGRKLHLPQNQNQSETRAEGGCQGKGKRERNTGRETWRKPQHHLTFNGRPGPSTAMALSHVSRGRRLSPSHISGEQSAVMASSRSSTQLAMGPGVGWMIRWPPFWSCTHDARRAETRCSTVGVGPW